MLVDQLDLPAAFQHQAELVEARDHPLQHHTVHEEQGHPFLVPDRGAEELVLQAGLGTLTVGRDRHEIRQRFRRHDGRDGMLIDELRTSFAPQQQREGVEPGDDALKLDSLDEEDGDRLLGAADAVEEMILQTQRSRHLYSSPSRFSPIPSAFNFLCNAERSMPMNEAVREMLPEKRLIWILRYSRSNASRASRNGLPMIAMPVFAPLMLLWLSRTSGG